MPEFSDGSRAMEFGSLKETLDIHKNRDKENEGVKEISDDEEVH